MKSLKKIQKELSEAEVAQSNFFRFQTPEVFEFAINNLPKLKSVKFLEVTFGFNLTVASEVIKRVQEGETFVEVTNDLNLRRLL